MKESFFLLVFIALFFGKLFAQDTLDLSDVRELENCYIPSGWPRYPDDFTYNDYTKNYEAQLFIQSQNHQQQVAYGFRMFTDDTLEVCGLAAVMCAGNTLSDWNGWTGYGDTSSIYAYTWLMLFAAEPDSLRCLVDTTCTYVHAWQRPQYYVKLNWGLPEYVVLPLYERYFTSAVTVTDSFYLGNIVQREHWINQGSDILFVCAMTDLNPPHNRDTVDIFERTHLKYHNTMYDRDEDYWTARWSGIVPKCHPLFFPILAPPDTTDNPGGDTLAIDRNDPVYRYTNVAPNPATETVRVTSSFGLSRIEAYDLKGHLISEFRTPNSEFSTTLDVSSWPRGTYLLRITTPAGPTTKKLLIQ